MAEARKSPKAKMKKVSPKVRKTAELYKSSHNIGNRRAAEWVGSYKESEVTLVYPEGFWDAVKLEDMESDHSPIRSPRSLSPPSKHSTPVKKRFSDEGPKSPRSPSSGRKKDFTHIKELKVVLEKSDSDSERSPRKKHKDKPDRRTSCKKEKDSDRSTSPNKRSSSRDNKLAASKKRTARRSSAVKTVRPRAIRIKRTACLNAAAIVGLLYENEEPSPKRHRVEESGESEKEEDEEDGEGVEEEEESESEIESDHQNEKEADNYDVFNYTSEDEEISFKPRPSEMGKLVKKEKTNETKKRDKSKEKNKDKEKSNERKKEKVKSKEKDKEKSGKGNKKPAPKKKPKKKAPPSDESSEESDESEDEVTFKRKAEDDIPLWPPPKRMASLNAQAIWTASREPYRRVKTEKTSKPEKKDSKGKDEKTEASKEPKVEVPPSPGNEKEIKKSEKESKKAEKETAKKADKETAKKAEKEAKKSDKAARKAEKEKEKEKTIKSNDEKKKGEVTRSPVRSMEMMVQRGRPDQPEAVSVVRPIQRSTSPDIQIISAQMPQAPPLPSGGPPPAASPDVQIIEVKVPPHQPYMGMTRPYQSHSAYMAPTSRTPPHMGQQSPISQGSPHMPQMSSPMPYPPPPPQPYPPPHIQPHHQQQPPHHPQQQHHQQMPPQQQQQQQQQQQSVSQQQQQQQQPPPQQYPPQQHTPSQPPPPPPPHHQNQSFPYQPHQGAGPPPHQQPFPVAWAPAMDASSSSKSMGSPTIAPPSGPPQFGGAPSEGSRAYATNHNFGSAPPSKAQCNGRENSGVDTSMDTSNHGPIINPNFSEQGHNYAHRTSPMGNTCTYPYPHNQSAAPPTSHCQNFPNFSSMGMSTYHMMSACHRPYGTSFSSGTSAFSVPSFAQHHSFAGYYQPGAMVQSVPDTCCIPPPFSYHVHQQQVKVLVHNSGLPAHPSGYSSVLPPNKPPHMEHPRDMKPHPAMSPRGMMGPDHHHNNGSHEERPYFNHHHGSTEEMCCQSGRCHSNSNYRVHHNQHNHSMDMMEGSQRKQQQGMQSFSPPGRMERGRRGEHEHRSSGKIDGRPASAKSDRSPSANSNQSAGAKSERPTSAKPERSDRSPSTKCEPSSSAKPERPFSVKPPEAIPTPPKPERPPSTKIEKFVPPEAEKQGTAKTERPTNSKSPNSKSDKVVAKVERVTPTKTEQKQSVSKTEKVVNPKAEKSSTTKSEKSASTKSEKVTGAKLERPKSEKSPNLKSEKSSTLKSEKSPVLKSEKPVNTKTERPSSTSPKIERPSSAKSDRSSGTKSPPGKSISQGKSTLSKSKANGEKNETNKNLTVIPPTIKISPTNSGKSSPSGKLSPSTRSVVAKQERAALNKMEKRIEKQASKSDKPDKKLDKKVEDKKKIETAPKSPNTNRRSTESPKSPTNVKRTSESPRSPNNTRREKTSPDKPGPKNKTVEKSEAKSKKDESSKVRREPTVPKKEDPKKLSRGMRSPVPAAVSSMWRWEGQPEIKQVSPSLSNMPDAPPEERKCYPAVRHSDGDLVRVRDCVLVRSGPRKTDVPYVAKIASLWERPGSGEMMMNVLWYYRPEHTESERLPRHIPSEIFASKHRDETNVNCIDDKCHVLTYNEYCRYRSLQKQALEGCPTRPKLVPDLEDDSDTAKWRERIPSIHASAETVFLCRRVYDVKLKRVLKNPTPS